MKRNIYGLTVLALAASEMANGCGAKTGAPEPTVVEPATMIAGTELRVTIKGQGFAPAMLVDLKDADQSQVSAEFSVRLGSWDLVAVSWVDETTLTAIVPSTVLRGTYDLSVTAPDGQTGMIVSAFAVEPCLGPSCACVAGESYCAPNGRTLHSCNDSGSGPVVEADRLCGLACIGGRCAAVSNIGDDVVALCDVPAPVLTPSAAQTIVFSSQGIECPRGCGDGKNLVESYWQDDNLVAFCVSRLSLPANVTLAANGSETRALILVVAEQAARIAGTIDLPGANAVDGDGLGIAGGGGGPGGGAGADGCNAQRCSGNPGSGPGPGNGGLRAVSNQAGGGGGGGNTGMGGAGGLGGTDGVGGSGGPSYSTDATQRLIGGSGGGSGGDGGIGEGSGPGGGGGGAIQIISRVGITIDGVIRANGGAGGNAFSDCGAGGGGSGGTVVLEAAGMITISGFVVIQGGRGGANASVGGGTAGAGASGLTIDGEPGGVSATAGGGGGGGGAGRVRLSGIGGVTCQGVDPIGSCTVGAL